MWGLAGRQPVCAELLCCASSAFYLSFVPPFLCSFILSSILPFVLSLSRSFFRLFSLNSLNPQVIALLLFFRFFPTSLWGSERVSVRHLAACWVKPQHYLIQKFITAIAKVDLRKAKAEKKVIRGNN